MSAHYPKEIFAGSRMHPFQSGSLCIQTRIGAVYSIGETGSSPDTITCGHATPHPSAKENHFLLEMLENTLRSLILEVWNIILRMYKQENEFEHSFRWKDTLPRFLYLMHTNCRYHHTVKWYADQLYVSPDALSAKLKKLYGKTANQLISESLIEEAKVCLLNPPTACRTWPKSSVSLTRLLSASFSNATAECRPPV